METIRGCFNGNGGTFLSKLGLSDMVVKFSEMNATDQMKFLSCVVHLRKSIPRTGDLEKDVGLIGRSDGNGLIRTKGHHGMDVHVEMDDQLIPPHLLCPITKKVFVNAVFASDGETYDRGAIEGLLQECEKKSQGVFGIRVVKRNACFFVRLSWKKAMMSVVLNEEMAMNVVIVNTLVNNAIKPWVRPVRAANR